MAQTGFTPIKTYYSQVSGHTPTPSNLAYGELALNIVDGKLFYKDATNTVRSFTGGNGNGSFVNLEYTGTLTGKSNTGDIGIELSSIFGGAVDNYIDFYDSTGTYISEVVSFEGNYAEFNAYNMPAYIASYDTYQTYLGVHSGATQADAYMHFYVGNGYAMRINGDKNIGIGTETPKNRLDIVGSFGRGAPVTKTADFTLAATENWIINNKSGSTCTVTLPAASLWPGREFTIKNIQAQTVVSASANVVPLTSATAGTAILAATAGKWATLVSNGTNWVIMQGN